MEPKEFDIEFTRGDTCPIKFSLVDSNGTILELKQSDELYFTVKDNFNTTTEKLQKTYGNGDITKEEDGSYKLVIEAEDTNNWKYGSYVFDICLVSGDYTRTVVIGNLTLTNEVTF